MDMSKPGIVVVGAGLIGRRHIEQAMHHRSLSAIVDPSDGAAHLAAELGVPHFGDLGDCLAKARADGAVIATPNHLHADQAVACLEAGVPVLIEKPIANSIEAANHICATAAQAGVPVLIGHHRRHNPIVKRAKAALDAGDLGEVVTVQGQFWLYKPDDYFDAAWRKEPGAGPTLINLIHDIDLLRHFCGEIVEILAMRSNHQRRQDVEDTAALIMRFESGALGSFTLSDTVAAPWSWEMTSGENPIYPHRPGACYMLGGTKAALSVPDLKLWTHEGPRSWWNPINASTLQVNHADAFALQFAHFLEVVSGAPPLVSAEEGRASLAAVLSVLEVPLMGKDTP